MPEFATSIDDLPQKPAVPDTVAEKKVLGLEDNVNTTSNTMSMSSITDLVKDKRLWLLAVLFWIIQFPQYTDFVMQVPILSNAKYSSFRFVIISLVFVFLYWLISTYLF